MNKLNATTARLTLTGLVTAAIFKVSASHIMDVATKFGTDKTDAWVYPAAIDGMILVSALTLVANTGVNKKAKFYAGLGRWIGFAFTIYANMLHAGWASTDAVLVNMIPAVALIITIEILVHAAQQTPAAKRTRQAASKAPAKLKVVA